MVDLSEIPEPLHHGYRVRGERELLKDYWVYESDAYPHDEDVLIAVKTYPPTEEDALVKAEFFVSAHPARFVKIRCHRANGGVVEITTGSGNIAEYIRTFLPILDMWAEAMLGITCKGDE